MAPSEVPADEQSSKWQDLELEQDVLRQIFERIGSTQQVKLTGVSSAWREIINTTCIPGESFEVSSSQSQSESFAAWADAHGSSVRHLKVIPSSPKTPSFDGSFLLDMTRLQSYLSLVHAGAGILRQMPTSVKHLNVKLDITEDLHNCQICLGSFINLTKLALQCRRTHESNAIISLPETAMLQSLELSSSNNLPLDFHLLPSPCLKSLKSLQISFISTQGQLEHLMTMTTLEELSLGIDTDLSKYGDSIDITGIEAMANLTRLNLQLHTCYLRNAHMLQRLPQLQHLGVDMSDDAAVLFRPEDGSSFALPCQLDNLQHIELGMHSVFDVTDCLEGLRLVSRIPSLRVILLQSSSRGPSEVHWAIKEGSILARAVQLRHLHVSCTSMLINLLPPSLKSLYVVAKKINVKSDLCSALNMLDGCHLQSGVDVEYF